MPNIFIGILFYATYTYIKYILNFTVVGLEGIV